MQNLIDLELVKKELKRKLPLKRYIHSLNVSNTAVKLCRVYNVCKDKGEIAGLLHDYAKYLSNDEMCKYIEEFKIEIDEVINSQKDLAHGLIGAELVKRKFKIQDLDILNSIRYHTTGRKEMTNLEKIIYLSDYIEPNRKFPGIEEIRKMALKDLNKATLMALDNTIKYIIIKGLLLHSNSLLARNNLILEMNASGNICPDIREDIRW